MPQDDVDRWNKKESAGVPHLPIPDPNHVPAKTNPTDAPNAMRPALQNVFERQLPSFIIAYGAGAEPQQVIDACYAFSNKLLENYDKWKFTLPDDLDRPPVALPGT